MPIASRDIEEPRHPVEQALAPRPMPTGPRLYVEVRLSRQYRQHVLIVPGEPKPMFYIYLVDACEEARRRGVTELAVIADECQYSLRLEP